MDVEEARRQINSVLDQWYEKQKNPTTQVEEVKPERTDGKRAVRSKSTGDRVMLLDDNEKTKAWITSPEILAKLGFDMADVEDVEDSEMLQDAMSPSIYRVDE